jgi:putative colanic acid biosynthesis acetyltransferase WcaF
MKTHINYINTLIFRVLPETRFFGLKRYLMRLAGIKIGENSRVCSSVTISGNGTIEIGDNVWIGPQVFLSASTPASIKIASHCGIAPQTYIATGTHEIDYEGLSSLGPGLNLDVIIEEGAWIGPKVAILPGLTIGKKAIVAAGAVVSKDVAEKTMVGGVPAKFMKNIADV